MAAISNNGLLLLSCVAPLLLLLLSSMASATQFRVGGPMGWTVPNAMSYNQWAQRNRFKIGDSLLFVYQGGDSVLQVSADGYNTCNTSSYIHKFSDGNTAVFALDHSGPYYFISGVENNCLRNESLVVVVLSDRSTSSSSSPPPMAASSPPPSPSEVASPPPSPSPSTASPPPPPPPTPSEVTPSPSSTTGGGGESSPSPPPSKNGASLKKTSVGFQVGTSGAFLMGSLLFL